jgi:hypothetical protein
MPWLVSQGKIPDCPEANQPRPGTASPVRFPGDTAFVTAMEVQKRSVTFDARSECRKNVGE